eukprot:gnl/MRDRNA2_/MRDRNA2_102244_c0_seq1.p1 gnl/MRDRNA2_/MRDRNA2_102244_c0~~gnl/MRDRNA2_/MRDRNA2_102244_c0_seq1.p1  ORF type:complete len:484 (-),score=67.95 gnl/MRDRNA2_/MRDRNA2_102244_c0_seq1:187-1638(-)
MQSKFHEYVVAIPSYDRPEEIEAKTLALLKKHCIPESCVYIFVANEHEHTRYAAALGDRWPNLIVGVPSLWRQRNFITNYFPEGLHIVSLDDDVEEIYRVHVDSSRKLPQETEPEISHVKDWRLEVQDYVIKPLRDGDFPKLIKDARRKMEKHGAYLWALNVSDNPFFMRRRFVTKKLGLCNGFLWGCRNRHDVALHLKYGDGHEDVERSVRFFHMDGVLVRYREFCAKTKCFFKSKVGNAGGLQSSMTKKERQAAEERGNRMLCEEFPEFLKLSPGSILGVTFRTTSSSVISDCHLSRLLMKSKLSLLEGASWSGYRLRKKSSQNDLMAHQRTASDNMLFGTVECISAHGIVLWSTNHKTRVAMSLGHLCNALRAKRILITWVPKAAQEYLGLECKGIAPTADFSKPVISYRAQEERNHDASAAAFDPVQDRVKRSDTENHDSSGAASVSLVQAITRLKGQKKRNAEGTAIRSSKPTKLRRK